MIQTIDDYDRALSAVSSRLCDQGFDDYFSDLEYIEYTHSVDGVLLQGRLQAYRKTGWATWVFSSSNVEVSSEVEPSLVRQLFIEIWQLPVFAAFVSRWEQADSTPFDPIGCHIVGLILNDDGKLVRYTFAIPADVADGAFCDWLRLLYSTRPDAAQNVRTA